MNVTVEFHNWHTAEGDLDGFYVIHFDDTPQWQLGTFESLSEATTELEARLGA